MAMATSQMSSDPPSRPSFAKVAATTSDDKRPQNLMKRASDGPTNVAPMQKTDVVATGPVVGHGTSHPVTRASPAPYPVAIENVAHSLDCLGLDSKSPSFPEKDGISPSAEGPSGIVSRGSGSDDFQRAESSSELGTKPPSLDEKSITSGTTFALDEKESLRPDDSASVKAAAEDDDSVSLRGSFITGSRMGSEVAARARAIQLGDVIPERRLGQPPPGMHVQGVSTPQSASSDQAQVANRPVGMRPTEPSPDALNVIYQQAPDEKLLEALASAKDKIYLLRLEGEVIDFVQNSKEPYMDLPPSNSFCRMLTHKLADYYHMTHSFEPHIGSVRIFRTPFCRLPQPLSTMNPFAEAPASTPPPSILPRKIMRRGQDGENGSGSTEASKATSEVGSDAKAGKDAQASVNSKLSREEREAQYKIARERIFGSSEETVPENEDGNDLSRASSVSANRSNTGRKPKPARQRRDDSDSFDSRHHYTPYWGPQQQTWVQHQPSPTQFMPPQNNQFGAQPQPVYPGPMTPAYGTHAGYASGPGAVPNGYPGFPSQQFPQSAPTQRYQSSDSSVTSYSSPAPPQSGWPSSFHSPSQQSRQPPGSSGGQAHSGIPYAYGQLPAHANPNDPKSQHPIPGSYNRNHNFNPTTQSFIPGGATMVPGPQPQPPFTAPGSHHGSPQIGAPHLAYSGYSQPMPQSYGPGYGIARQGSSNSVPAYPSPQNGTSQAQHGPYMQQGLHPGPMQQQQQMLPHHPVGGPSPRPPNVPQGPSSGFTHLPTYGNPATLPQKPTTGI